ncbi:MAG: radical SAM protein [Candidatus Omnitrophica bacterium]|nr:radical SAM protein [Candidatus Omnitrophota bacterium]
MMVFKKVLLINPAYKDWIVAVPAGLAYIAAAIEKIGVSVKVIDCRVEKGYKKKILDGIESYFFVGISVNVVTVKSAIEIAEMIRSQSPKTKIIMGGPHATAVYQHLIPKYADIITLGAAEDTIVDLIENPELSKVSGLAYWDGEIKLTPKRDKFTEIEKLPFPAWHYFDFKKYRMPGCRLPRIILITSRGCPYNCINCTKIIHGSHLRMRSADNVLEEIDYMVKRYKVKEIWVSDDNFTFSPERVKELCRKIIKANYDLRFHLTNGVRADIVDEEMFQLMARAGFVFVSLGVESGSQEVIDKLRKRLDLRVIKKTVLALKKANLQVGLFVMIGLPFETEQTMRQTIDFAKSLPADQAFFWMVTPFPGTVLYDMIKKDGVFLRDLILEGAPSYSAGEPLFEMNHLKSQVVKKYFKKAHREFFLRPSQIVKSLKKRTERLYNFYDLYGLIRSGYKVIVRGGRM